jgi:UDP:flavonoid glycosyltransferase YjiC (YdhE family)
LGSAIARLIADQPMKKKLGEIARHMQAAKGTEKAARILSEIATKGSFNP